MPFFSVIVPIFNVESYLWTCVNSILDQDYGDYELILVDDGSTDQSGAICDKIASLHENVVVIHKANGGLSDARNVGLKKAQGEYVVFIDSDDYIDPGSFNALYCELQQLKNPEVLVTQIKRVYDDGQIQYVDKHMPVDLLNAGGKDRVIRWMFTFSKGLWPTVRYIVNRKVVLMYNLRFPVGYLHEDIQWTARLFACANSIMCSKLYWYNHRMDRPGSITSQYNTKRTMDVIEMVVRNCDDEIYLRLDPDLREIVFRRMITSLFISLRYSKYASDIQLGKIAKTLEINQKLLSRYSALKYKLFLLLCRLFGFRLCLQLLYRF